MEKLSYKSFVWPNNPTTFTEERERTAEYVTGNGVTVFEGISDVKRKIYGSGVFYGPGAYDNFKKLMKLFEEEKTPGNLEHPIWGIRYCYFTGLEMTQEPRENYVSYRFTFTGARNNGEVPK